MLFVSHNMTAVQKLCERSMLLSRGRKIIEGPTGEVIQEYVAGVRSDAATPLVERADREGTGRFRFQSIGFEGPDGPTDMPVTGEDVEIVLRYTSPDGRPIRNAGFAVGIYTVFGVLILQCQSDLTGIVFRELAPSGRFAAASRACRCPRAATPSTCSGRRQATSPTGCQRATELTVAEGDYSGRASASRRATSRCSSTRTGWSRRAPVRDCPPDCPRRLRPGTVLRTVPQG